MADLGAIGKDTHSDYIVRGRSISGIVYIAPATPGQREVVAFDYTTNAYVGRVRSSADGTYTIYDSPLQAVRTLLLVAKHDGSEPQKKDQVLRAVTSY